MRLLAFLLSFLLSAGSALAGDELAPVVAPDGFSFNYVLTTGNGGKPAYAVILMPGGNGNMSPRLVNGKVVFNGGGNFLIRSRAIFAEGPFVAASTDATSTPGRILAITADLEKRFGPLKIYVVGTSRSTEATMALSGPLDGRVAGFVHSSSVNAISSFDPRKFKSRHLIVLHRMDGCKVTKPAMGEASHRSYGTELIEIDGGKSVDDDCEAFAHHGYNGVERETVQKIKDWIVAGK
ncbi:MAG TPA: hypothetical protein VMI56_21960 [Reyranella sp.]|nr:hypothetical protein [Reyranella sp.]